MRDRGPQLHATFREVLANGVSGDVVQGMGFRNLVRFSSDGDEQFGLVIEFSMFNIGNADVDVGSGQRRLKLGEYDEVFWIWNGGLIGVITIVDADGKDLTWLRDRC